MTSPSICRCVCGAEASVFADGTGAQYSVQCHHFDSCGWKSPVRDTEAEAVAAWNRVMGPRPVPVDSMRTLKCPLCQGLFCQLGDGCFEVATEGETNS